MRTYYASDKKRREEAKRKQKEEKRLKRLNKASKSPNQTGTESASNNVAAESDVANQGTER